MADDPLSVGASIINVIHLTGNLVSLAYEYVWGVDTVPFDLQQLTDELQSFGKVLASLRNYSQADPNPQSSALQEINGQNGPLCECAIELKRLRLRMETGEGLRDNTKRLQWPLKVNETMKRISQIQKHKNVFTLLLQLLDDRDKLSQAMEGYTQDKNSARPLVQSTPVQDAHIAQKRKDDLDWLYPADFESRHLEISRRRKTGTGVWLPEAPEFEGWVKGEPGYFLLWGRGNHGVGKTFLSSVAIDHLQSQAQESNYGVAYIYFNYMERYQQQPKHVLRSLIKQLTCQTLSFPAEIEKLYTLREIEEPSFGKLYTILLEKSKLFDRVFLIFDGLDECSQEIQLKDLLPLFHRLTEDRINVFITSRLQPGDIQTSLQGFPKIDLSAKAEDIKTYIQQKIDEDLRVKHLVGEGKFRDKVVTELLTSANGMFLLARLHIEIVCQQPTVKDILKELETLKVPQKDKSLLDSAYDKIIDKVRKQHTNCVMVATKIFMWLAKAQRTLTVDELREAISISMEESPVTSELDEWGLPNKATLLGICANLVTIDEDNNTVRFAHYTTQKYLLKSSILPADADLQMAKACTNYLLFDDFSSVCESWDAFKNRLKVHRFFAYATKYFSVHIKACDLALTKNTVYNLIHNKGKRGSYMQAIDFYRQRIESPLSVSSTIGHLPLVRQIVGSRPYYNGGALESSGRCSALSEAVRGGHKEVVKLLLEVKLDTSVWDEDGKTALHWAARRGHKDIVELLLDYKLDTSKKPIKHGRDGRTALHEAVRGSHKDIVELLLLKNSTLHSHLDKNDRSALYEAAREGQEEITKLLLEKGANASTQDKYGQTPLHLAAFGGHEQVIQLLLKSSANVLAKTNSGITALHEAAYRGYKDILSHLLEGGADISAKDKHNRTALSMAAGEGHKEVVQLLLDNHANTSAQAGDAQAALHEAVYGGHEEIVQLIISDGVDISDSVQKLFLLAAGRGHKGIVQLLLENGADVWAQGSMGWSAIHQAAYGGHKETVQLLLEHDVDIWAQMTDGRTALHLAASRGHEQIIQLLLENGTDIPIKDKNGQTALHIAICGVRIIVQKGLGFTSTNWKTIGHEKVVDLLLKNGANTSDKDNQGRTALHLSAEYGNKKIIQLLLDNGANLSDKDKQDRTALHLSAECGNMETIQFLLDSGAQALSPDMQNKTILHSAVEGGNMEIVQFLLENGANLSDKDKQGRTALHLSVQYGKKEIIQLLLKNGAQTLSLDKQKKTILHSAVEGGNMEIVQLLFDNRSTTEGQDEQGMTVLHLSAKRGDIEITRALLKKGSKIDVQDKQGMTALHLSAKGGHYEIVEMLLKKNANASICDEGGLTAYIWADRGGHDRVLQLFYSRGIRS